MNTIYGYARVSTNEQALTGISLEAQEFELLQYMKMKANELGLRVGPIYIERLGVSALKVPLGQRPEGKRLSMKLESGDHVVFSKHDRAFRRTKDMILVVEAWGNLGVVSHFKNLGIDSNSAHGRMILTIMTACAQWESEAKGERQKEMLLAMAMKNKPVVGTAPAGVIRVGKNTFVYDRTLLAIARLVRIWRRTKTKRECGEGVELIFAKREGRKPIHFVSENFYWKEKRMQGLHHALKSYESGVAPELSFFRNGYPDGWRVRKKRRQVRLAMEQHLADRRST